MAGCCYLSSFSAYTSFKHYVFHRPPSLHLQQPLLQPQNRRSPSPFPDRSVVSASSTKKPRARKKVKSNAELCNDIREFVFMVGLPQGHVPSLKELSQHGRQDLANIVRRRGYKLIKELMNSPNLESNMEVSSCGSQNGTDLYDVESTGLHEEVNELAEGVPLLEGQDEDVNCVPALNPGTQHWGSGDSSLAEGVPLLEGHDEEVNSVPALNSGVQSWESGDFSTEPSLQEKAANFVQNGKLDTIEIEDMELLTESYSGHSILSESSTIEGKTCKEMENKIIVQSAAPIEENSIVKDAGSNVTSVSNGITLKSKQVAHPTAETGLHRSDLLPTEGLKDTGLDVEACERENEVEINSLKVLLHRKELELSQLKEQIEKEQHVENNSRLTFATMDGTKGRDPTRGALSILQTKAETEISKAQKLISSKDAELHAAEESLLGLKEVQVEYWANGNNVEVAGSFNGWNHRIKMDLHPSSSTINSHRHPSSSTINSHRSRKSRLWSTVLWLYPGVYEMKFIVDGHWMIDHQRESITIGNIQNNILRVDG